MIDFKNLENVCKHNSETSASVVDEFLMYYAAGQGNLEREMNRTFKRFRHITDDFQPALTNMLKAQYIVHRIFKKDGMIHKLLNHSAVRELAPPKRQYLENQAKYPWKFSFSIIADDPAENFYEMEDVFSGDSFLVYSPGIGDTLQETEPCLWFNLVAFNGSCWETYGPIAPFRGFEADDIFFFASEMRPSVETDEDLLADVEENPVPYMALWSGSMHPLVFHKKDQIVQVISEHDLEAFETDGLDKYFKIEYAQQIYRLGLKGWNEYPHFSTAYYDEKMKILLLSALTDRGFDVMTHKLNALGFDLPEEPQIRVNQSIVLAAAEILRKKINLNDYERFFQKDTDHKSEAEIDRMNQLLGLILPDINAGREPDIEAAAKQTGVDPETAKAFVQQAMSHIGKMRG